MSVNDSTLWTLIAIIIVIPSAAHQFNTTIRTWTCNSAITSTFLSTSNLTSLKTTIDLQVLIIVFPWPSQQRCLAGYDGSPLHPVPCPTKWRYILNWFLASTLSHITVNIVSPLSITNQFICPWAECPTIQRIEYENVTSPRIRIRYVLLVITSHLFAIIRPQKRNETLLSCRPHLHAKIDDIRLVVE